MLFHALTGAPPYERSNDEATLWAHLNDPPPELNDEAAIKAVSGLYRLGLEALKKKIESGS